MNSYLRQSTASQSRALGPFLSSTDFFTAQTALTIANTDIKLVVNGAASANKNSGGGTHRINGVYGVTFDATDTATVGELFVSVVVAGALPVFHTFQVFEEAVFDALFAGSAPGYLQPTVAARTLDVSATGEAGLDWANIGAPTTAQTLSGTTIGTATAVTTVNGFAANSITAAAIANGAIDAATFAANAIDATAIANGAIDAATFAAGAINAAAIASGAITNAKFAAGAIDAAAVATDAIDADALAASAVTEMQAGLATATVQTQIKTVTDKLDTALELDGAVYRFTTNALEQAPTGSGGGGTPPTVGEIADAVWDELLSGHASAGSAGAILSDLPSSSELFAMLATADDATLAAIAALNNVSQAQVQTAATAALTAYDPPTHAELTAAIGAGDDATLAAIAALPTATANADTLLARPLAGAGGGAPNERTVRSALRFLRNRWSITAGVLTVRSEDDVTTAWTANVGTSPGDPVSDVDPL